VTKPILYEDGSDFAAGNEVKVMYYQHPDLMKSREIILNCEATYYELATCLDETYNFYPGLQNLTSVNRHVIYTNEYVCWGKDVTDGSKTDPTYIWDPGKGGKIESGYGLYSYIY